jgi:multiple sugar transport system substrate-binding protein
VVTTLAISVYSKNKATALDFIKFIESEENQKFYATQGSLAPVLTSLYDDKELVAKLPYLPCPEDVHRERGTAPRDAVLPGGHKAIQENAYSAIKGEKPVDTALSDMQKSIESAGAGS